MAHFLKKAFQLTPNQILHQQKRFRGKINVQKPKAPHYTRALVEEFLTPFYIHPLKDKTNKDLCTKKTAILPGQRKLTPYELIIAREVRNWFDNSKMIACFHRNSMTQEEYFEVRVPLKKVNMYLKIYSYSVVKEAIQDSPYFGIEPLLRSYFAFIFSPEINVIDLQKIVKKEKRLQLIGGVLEGHVLNQQNFLKYGAMDITTARTGLVQVLQNAGGVNLSQQLTHHQSTLVSRLKQIGTNETTPNENEKSVPV